VHTFRNKQSSLAVLIASPTIGVGACGQMAPYVVASRTPDQGCTVIGSRHRRSPVGGAAKGMPLNTAPLLSAAPRICPPVTPTIGAVCARLPNTATPTMSIAITTRIMFPQFVTRGLAPTSDDARFYAMLGREPLHGRRGP